VRRPERPEAKGEMRRRGRSEIPALVGVERETAWKRWGMLTTREVKGKPVKKAFLFGLYVSASPPSFSQENKREE